MTKKREKREENKKKLPAEAKSSLITLIVIAAVFGALIPLHFVFPEVISAYWVVAISVAIISPFAIINAKIYFESKSNYTEEQKKHASATFGLAILTTWYVDFVFICLFMDWLVAFFIFAGIFLIKLVYDTTSAIYKRKNPTSYPNVAIIVDYLFGFALLIFMIYKIPDEKLQTIVLSLSAALVGGLLTLLGVMLTIKKSDADKKREREDQVRPFFFWTTHAKGNNGDKKINTKFFNSVITSFGIDLGWYQNSSKIEFVLSKIRCLDKEYCCVMESAVAKEEVFQLFIGSDTKLESNPDSFVLIVNDVDGREIEFEITLEWHDYMPIIKTIAPKKED